MTGGLHGVKEAGLLQSAVERPKATIEGKDLYKDIFHKTAALMEYRTNTHPFIDGNKRTAVTSSTLFLQFNGYLLNTSQKKLEKFHLKWQQIKHHFKMLLNGLKRIRAKYNAGLYKKSERALYVSIIRNK